jgi:hypothetical protein
LTPSGCGWWGGRSAAVGQEFSLGVGDRVTIRGEGLSIVFADVVEDSRCATGVVCIWEGLVRCSVLLTRGGSTYTETFIQQGLSAEPATESALGYEFAFRVTPYPQAGKEIAMKDYRMEITVTVL